MKKLWFLTLLLTIPFLGALSAEAANHFVRAGASGSANGSDWANAYTTLPSTLTRGDTYYVADGAYGSVTFNSAASSTTLITIKKATVADHGTSTGWDDTFGDGQAVFGQFTFSSPYWLIDGQVGGGPGNWKTGFGFKISWSSPTPLINLPTQTPSNVTIRHIELQGTSNSSGGGGNAQDGVALWGADAFTISYFYTHAIGRCPFFISPGNGFLAEYGYVADYVSTPAAHSETASIWSFGQAFPAATTTFRYNIFGYVQGTGGLMWDNSSNHNARLDVYGNVFWNDPTLSGYNNGANGVIGGWTGSNGEDFFNVHVYNNTFVNVPGSQVLSTFPIRNGNNEARNNLFYTVNDPGGNSDWQTVTHNHFISTSSIGTSTSTGSGNPFVDMNGLNFKTTTATPAGVSLPAPYNTDMFGNVRGATGVWNRGAYELASGSVDTTAPTAPVNLRIQ
ncbi:hypothetical protein AYO43_07270 [Nitrospira sp. SCGC AG-212-E16]|nr:hypothetical protein AYO43_07270 [Nitrospira sp. SCGC AG-212-E16]